MDMPAPVLFKAVSGATFKWKELMKKGGIILKSWLSISPPLQESLISPKTAKSLRDYILSVLKGIGSGCNSYSHRSSITYARAYS